MHKVTSFCPLHANTMRGFVGFQTPDGIVVNDAILHVSGDRAWIGLPGRPQIDRDGQVVLDDRGKRRYTPCAAWVDRDASDRIQAELIAQIRATYPEALAANPPPAAPRTRTEYRGRSEAEAAAATPGNLPTQARTEAEAAAVPMSQRDIEDQIPY